MIRRTAMNSAERYERLAGRLGELHKRVRRMQEQWLREYDISLLEYHIIIAVMRSDEISQSDIAAALDVDKALISRQINTMVNKGLITRDDDPNCRRKNKLSLSESTRNLIPSLMEAHRLALERVFADVDEGRLDDLEAVLEGLVNKL